MSIPLFFDHGENRLARGFRDGSTRLYCISMTATTVFVYLTLSDEKPFGQLSARVAGCEHRRSVLKTGSWRQMYLSQPSCFVSWRVTLNVPVGPTGSGTPSQEGGARETFSGIVKGERTMDALLDGLAESLVVKGR
jgi:hypothetical protein